MNQQGYIIELVDDITAKLKMKRHSACASCGKCATTSESQDIVVEVDNTIGAKVGDLVEVNMETVNVLKAAFIVYSMPLIGLLLGTVISNYILNLIEFNGNIEVMSGVIGLLCMSIALVILKKNDSKYRKSKEYMPTVTKIIYKL